MQPDWVSEWEKSRNLSTHKNHATSPHTKSRNLLTTTKSRNLSTQKNHATSPKKIIQVLHKENHATSPQKSNATSPQKNHATSRNINHATWVIEKNPTTSPQTKITQPLHTQNQRNLSKKNIKQPPHKKSCNLSEWVRKITQPLKTKNHATSPHQKSCN